MRISHLLAITVLSLLTANITAACPFCSAPSLTLSEQLDQSDAAVLVQWVAGTPSDRDAGEIGSTTYEVVNVVQSGESPFKKGERITLDRFRSARVGDLFLVTGTQGTGVEWGSPLEVTEASFGYISQAPTPEAPIEDRLVYFMKFLEYPDDLVPRP